jgi:hypothetical protein
MVHYGAPPPPPPPPPPPTASRHSDVHMTGSPRRAYKHIPVSRTDEDYEMDDYDGHGRRRPGSTHSSPDGTWTTNMRPSMSMYDSSSTSPSSFETSFARSPYPRSGYHNTSSMRFSQTGPFAADHRERALTHARSDRTDLDVAPPAPGASENQVDEALLRYVTNKIQSEETYGHFWRWKASAPSTFMVLRMYRYVHSKMQEHVGMRPFVSTLEKVNQVSLLSKSTSRLLALTRPSTFSLIYYGLFISMTVGGSIVLRP